MSAETTPPPASSRPPEGERTRTPSAPGATPHSARTGNIDSIVADIRRELQHISAHELDLRRREEEFEQQYRRLEQAARQAARAEVEEAQKRLAQRSAALTAEALELTARRTRVDALTEKLRAQEARIQAQNLELQRQAEDMRHRATRVAERVRGQRQNLRRRIAAVREREQELAGRVQKARDDVLRQRAELARIHGEVQSRGAALARVEQELKARHEDVQRRLSAEASQVADLRQQAAQVAAEETRLAARRLELEESTAGERAALAARQSTLEQTLAAEREALAARQRELDKRWQATRDERRQLTRQADEVETRRQALAQDTAAAQERAKRLEQHEHELKGRTDQLNAERRRLADLEAELDRRQKDAEAIHARAAETERKAAEIERQAAEQRAAAAALHEQMQARDGESRQNAMAIEVEREELARDRALLESAGEALDGERARREQEWDQTRAALAADLARLEAAERALTAAPRRWWVRAGVLSVCTGLATALGWLALNPPLHRATAELAVTSPAPLSRLLTEHRAGLLARDLLAEADAGSRAAWQRALDEGRVQVASIVADDGTATQPATQMASEPDSPRHNRCRLELAVVAADGAAGGRLVAAAVAAYAQRVNGVPADAGLPRQYHDFLAWRDELQAALVRTRAQRDADATALAALPSPEEHVRAVDAADRAAAELNVTSAALDEQRSSLAALLATALGTTTVDPLTLDRALAEDEIWREDHREYHAASVKYRTELVVALLMLADPLKTVQQALGQFADAVAEQREMNPPAELVAALEQFATELTTARGRFAEFERNWREWVERVQGLDESEEAAEQTVLTQVTRQNEAADATRRLAEDAVRFAAELDKRLDALAGTGDGGTRAVVVAAVLRGHQAGLKSAADGFAAAAGRTALAGNVELDAQDRQLRGLQTRLAQRRTLLAERLQLDADRAAREEHTARIEQARAEVLRLEQQREGQAAALLTALQTARELEAAVRRHAELSGKVAHGAAEIERLQRQAGELEAKLAEARRAGPVPDRIEIVSAAGGGAARIEPLDTRRAARAAVAGAIGAAAAWPVALLTILRNPWRRRRSETRRHEGTTEERQMAPRRDDG